MLHIQIAEAAGDNFTAVRFTEKPELELAEYCVKRGVFIGTWNYHHQGKRSPAARS